MDRKIFIVCALIGLAPAAGAQIGEPQPGAHVRIHAPTVANRPFEARVVARMEDTLAVQLDDRPPIRIWMARIRELEVGRPSRMVGAIKGAGFGLPVGLGVAYYGVAQRECDAFSCTHGHFGSAVETTLIFGVLGAGIGMLVRGEKWDSLDLMLHSTSSIEVRGDGVGLRFAF
ncbi:MAG: hypothetical protein JWM95_2855 [Gemmatimonadetes bacterium]|nr:hypothetical protein [Gemmatimonadota bacterium]